MKLTKHICIHLYIHTCICIYTLSCVPTVINSGLVDQFTVFVKGVWSGDSKDSVDNGFSSMLKKSWEKSGENIRNIAYAWTDIDVLTLKWFVYPYMCLYMCQSTSVAREMLIKMWSAMLVWTAKKADFETGFQVWTFVFTLYSTLISSSYFYYYLLPFIKLILRNIYIKN